MDTLGIYVSTTTLVDPIDLVTQYEVITGIVFAWSCSTEPLMPTYFCTTGVFTGASYSLTGIASGIDWVRLKYQKD